MNNAPTKTFEFTAWIENMRGQTRTVSVLASSYSEATAAARELCGPGDVLRGVDRREIADR